VRTVPGISDDPARLASESLQGFVAAHPAAVRVVYGGVIRAGAGSIHVCLMVGGGRSHYPVFAGWLGPGSADGAVYGDVFEVPSAARICSLTKAPESGHGIVLGFGSNTWDVLQFGKAAGELRASRRSRRRVLPIDGKRRSRSRSYTLNTRGGVAPPSNGTVPGVRRHFLSSPSSANKQKCEALV